jgi:hypothetical protein
MVCHGDGFIGSMRLAKKLKFVASLQEPPKTSRKCGFLTVYFEGVFGQALLPSKIVPLLLEPLSPVNRRLRQRLALQSPLVYLVATSCGSVASLKDSVMPS